MAEKIYKAILVVALLIIIAVSGFGIYSGFGSKIYYKISDIFTPYNEYILSPSGESVKTDVYVDKNGKTVRKVPQQEIIQDTELNKDGTPKDNKKPVEASEPIDDQVKNYKIEKRVVADNPENVLGKDNVLKSQNIILDRLKASEIYDFKVRRDLKFGYMVVEVPQVKEKKSIFSDMIEVDKDIKSEADRVQSILGTTGTFAIKDKITGREYITEKNIKTVNTITYQEKDGKVKAGLQIDLTDEGKKILSDISRKYVQEEKNGKKIKHSLVTEISGLKITETAFTEPKDDGIVQYALGNMDEKNIEKNKAVLDEISRLERALKIGTTPIKYNVDKVYVGVESNLNKEMLKISMIVISVIMILMALSLVVIGGFKGVYALLVQFAYISVIALMIRYTEIVITVPALVGFVIAYVLQYMVSLNVLKKSILNDKNKKSGVYLDEDRVNVISEVTEVIKKTFVILISSIIFSFASNVILSSFGMILFISIILLYIHNYIFYKRIMK